MREKDTNIYLIHSIKGGCGKSACALFKTLQIASKQLKSRRSSRKVMNAESAGVLLIDADFRGSALQWLLFEDMKSGESKTDISFSAKSEIIAGKGLEHQICALDGYDETKNLNRYLKRGYGGPKGMTIPDILHRCCSLQPQEDGTNLKAEIEGEGVAVNGFFDLALSSSRMDEKKWFMYAEENEDSKMPEVSAGIYSHRMKTLLGKILEHGKTIGSERGQYSEIVIDMPPGYDEYSDLLLIELRRLKKKNKRVKLHYYSVTTNDIGHMHLTVDNIEQVKKLSSSYPAFDTVNVILNCMKEDDFATSSKDTDVENLIKVLKCCSGSVYCSEYVEGYHNFCRNHEITYFGSKNGFLKVSE